MVKRKSLENAAQEAADLQRRAKEIKSKAAFQSVVAILKSNPDACEQALDHLKDLGYDEVAAETKPISRMAAATTQRAKDRLLASSVHHNEAAMERAEFAPADLISPKVAILGGMTVPILMGTLLPLIERAGWSKANLRSMQIKGIVDSGAKVEYLRMVEGATSLAKDTPMSGFLRVWQSLEEHLALHNKWRGRRLRDTPLPIDWKRQGVYNISWDEGELFIAIRATLVRKPVPKDRVPASFDLEEVRIEFNWSESRATVYFSAGLTGASFPVVELFPYTEEHILPCYRQEFLDYTRTDKATPTFKAICDGGLGSAGQRLAIGDAEQTPKKRGNNGGDSVLGSPSSPAPSTISMAMSSMQPAASPPAALAPAVSQQAEPSEPTVPENADAESAPGEPAQDFSAQASAIDETLEVPPEA